MSNNVKLAGVPEILGAMLGRSAEATQAFKESPEAFLNDNNLSCASISASRAGISVAENSASMVHLALPYYSGVATSVPQVFSDNDMENASGGNIAFYALSVARGDFHRPLPSAPPPTRPSQPAPAPEPAPAPAPPPSGGK